MRTLVFLAAFAVCVTLVAAACSGDNEKESGGKCVCRKGYERFPANKRGKCVQECSHNARRKKGTGKCACNKGFADLDPVKLSCKKIKCGTNERLDGNVCKCKTGTSRVDGVCMGKCRGENEKTNEEGKCVCRKNYERWPGHKGNCIQICGWNSRRLSSGKCVCLMGYQEMPDGNCKKIRCGKNEVLDGNVCKCKEGNTRNASGTCESSCRRENNEKIVDGKCVCIKNYERWPGDKGDCVQICGWNSYRRKDGTCVCLMGYEMKSDGNCKKIRCPSGQVLDGNTCVPKATKPPPPPPTRPPPPPPTRPPPPPPTQPPPPPPPCQSNAARVNGVCTCNAGFVLQGYVCVDNRPCWERPVVPTKQWQLAAGVLYWVRACDKRYQVNSKFYATQMCSAIGAELAARGHLVQAQRAGIDNCACGWIQNALPSFFIQGAARKGCGPKSNSVNECQDRFMGRWGGPGWDVYCFKRGATLG